MRNCCRGLQLVYVQYCVLYVVGIAQGLGAKCAAKVVASLHYPVLVTFISSANSHSEHITHFRYTHSYWQYRRDGTHKICSVPRQFVSCKAVFWEIVCAVVEVITE